MKVHPNAKTIKLKADNKKEFFLIHGYSGSPGDLRELGEYLHKKFNANVKIIRLLGHGTCVEDLDGYNYYDFLNQIEKELQKSLKEGKKIIIGGYSFGAQLSFYLASKYPVKGLLHISMPYKFRFPFNLPIGFLGFFKKYWKKGTIKEEKEIMRKTFFYEHIHKDSLKICKISSKKVKKSLPSISVPCIGFHSTKDVISKSKPLKIIEKKIKSKNKKSIIFNQKGHNVLLFKKDIIFEEIATFFKDIFNEKIEENVSAIVPSYNEGKRIGDVLGVLTNTGILDEIIIIDDGSTDATEEIIKEFTTRYKKIKHLKNKKNMGKAYSMNKGVKHSKNSILFFCDADLRELTSNIVEEIISPVLNNEVDMSIGIRNNKMQKCFKWIAINSGERALRKELWEKIPPYYKHRYRIECGLNNFSKIHGRGFVYKTFPHYQTLKEIKYGFLKGTFLRWWMNFDVFSAILKSNLIDRFKEFETQKISVN